MIKSQLPHHKLPTPTSVIISEHFEILANYLTFFYSFVLDGTPVVLQTSDRQRRKSRVHPNPVPSVIAHNRHYIFVISEVVRLHIRFPVNRMRI